MLNIVQLGDCRELVKSVDDESIDFIFTDPPYDKAGIPLYGWLSEEAARVLKPGGFCMVYSGSMFLDTIMDLMRLHLCYFWSCWTYEPGMTPLIHARNVRQQSKPMMVYYKPPMKLPYHAMCNTFRTNNGKTWHKWGQDVSCARYYIHCLSQPGDILLEPFAGGGTTCVAAIQERRNFIAFEKDPVAWESTTKRLQTIQPKFDDFAEQMEIAIENT